PDDVAARYATWPTMPAGEAPLRALPIALFHAGQPQELREAVLGESELTGADAVSRLAAVSVAAAVSAGTFDMANGYDMAVAAVEAIDASVGGRSGAGMEVREHLRQAASATTPDALG